MQGYILLIKNSTESHDSHYEPPSPFYGAKFNPKVRFSLKHAELTFFKWYLAYWVCVQRNTKPNQVCVIEFGQMHKQSLHVYKLVKTNSPFPCLLQLSLHKTEILKQVYVPKAGQYWWNPQAALYNVGKYIHVVTIII